MFPEFAEGPSVPKASRGQPTEVDPPVTSQVSQTDSDTSNTARLRIALEENRRLELAIKTVRHSAGNQLALLSAMLARQARSSGDPALQNALTTAQLRVHAVAESLRAAGWGEAGGSVSAKSLVERVAGSLSELAASAGVAIEIDVQEMSLERDEAASFMLIVNELTVNSLKHGFPHNMSGTIRIRFAQDPDAPDRSLALMVEDNGIGRKRDDDYAGLGTTVILAAVQSLGAKLVEERTCANTERRGLRTTILKPLSHNACQ